MGFVGLIAFIIVVLIYYLVTKKDINALLLGAVVGFIIGIVINIIIGGVLFNLF